MDCQKQEYYVANKLLRDRLKMHDYIEADHTPGLFKHLTQSVWFTLTVDDFGIKYIGKQHALHLLNVLKSHHDMETD